MQEVSGTSFSPRKKRTHDRAESTYVPIAPPSFTLSQPTPTKSSLVSGGPHPHLPSFPSFSTGSESSEDDTVDLFSPTRSSHYLSPPPEYPSSSALPLPLPRRSSLARSLLFLILLLAYYLLPSFLPHFHLLTPFKPHPLHVHIGELHPLPSLLASANASHTRGEGVPLDLREAYERYRIRHGGRRPPKGWDRWWSVGRGLGAETVCRGEYEELYESLRVWWGVTVGEVRERVEMLAEVEGGLMGRVRVRGGRVIDWKEMGEDGIKRADERGEGDGKRVGFEGLLREVGERWKVVLPDVDMMINLMDQPRVVIQYDQRRSLESAGDKRSPRPLKTEKPTFHSTKSASLYSHLRLTCPPTSLALRTSLSPSPGSSPTIHHTHTTPFTTPIGYFLTHPAQESASWCSQPDLQELVQGFIEPPREGQLLEGVWPVFGVSKLRGFADVLLPSAQEYQTVRAYREERDVEWKAKGDKVFWRGSIPSSSLPPSTGNSGTYQWQGFLASRLVSKANRPSTWGHEDTFLLSDEEDQIVPATVKSSEIDRAWTDVAFWEGKGEKGKEWKREPSFRFTAAREGEASLEAEEDEAEEQGGHVEEAYGAKVILSLDADSAGSAPAGSPSLLPALASNSAVFLAPSVHIAALTHSLVPWVHYIPLSLRLSELYSLAGYFFSAHALASPSTSHEALRKGIAHEQQLKNVAEAGTKWVRQCARREDALLYAWLVVLEWARLTHEGRDEGQGDFVLGRGAGRGRAWS